MPLDPRARRFLDMAAAGAPSVRTRPTTIERRMALSKLMRFVRADAAGPAGFDGALPGPGGEIPYRIYAPSTAGGEERGGLVFFHGGGLVAGSIDTHDPLCRALAEASGCRVISVGYRLAPEHPFPAAVEDAIAATAWASAQAQSLAIDASRIAVGGDSAGATLAAVVCQEAVRAGSPPIKLQCLICPVLDAAGATASRTALAQGYLIDRATLDADLADYLPKPADATDPRVSPLRAASLAGLPAAIIHTAEFDPLRDEGDAYAERLAAAGVRVKHVRHPGMVHNFHALGAVLPEGRAALRQLGAEIRAALA